MSSESAQRRTAAPIVAAFDVDGTLTTRDCVAPFVLRSNGVLRTVGQIARRLPSFGAALLRRDRDALKTIAAEAVLTGKPYAELAEVAEAFAADVHRRRMRADTVELLRNHQAQGHTVVLVSASFGVYLRPLASLLGVEHVLATELEVDDAGRCTGRLVGGNCRGREKVVRLHAWLDGRLGGRAAVELCAYGDSAGDRELLADADRATWVRRA